MPPVVYEVSDINITLDKLVKVNVSTDNIAKI